MSFNVQDIKSQLVGGGARPNQFMVRLTNPGNNSADLKSPFMMQSASLPSSNLGTIQVPYFGRFIKLAGDRTFDPWTVSVINDEDFLIKNALEEWSNRINKFQENKRELVDYKADAEVVQFAKTGEEIRTYKFIGLFPSVVGSIELSWDQTDTIETFQVEFQYDYWVVSGGTTGDAGGK